MSILRLAMLQYPIEQLVDLDAYAAKLDRWVGAAAASGAGLLVMPEYACMEVAHALGARDDARAELNAVCERTAELVTAMRDAAMRHGVWLLPGTLPVRTADGVRNRAPLISPDGRIAYQEKRVMTRFERESWGVVAGRDPAVFLTPWGRIGISICYDLEFPTLVRAQVEAGAWLIVAPSCTDSMAGFNRIRLAARARAMENQCFVAVVPTIGNAPWSATLNTNRGYAALFGPVDDGFPEDGILARGALDEPQWIFVDLDPARLDTVRWNGAVRNHLDWPPAPPRCPVLEPS